MRQFLFDGGDVGFCEVGAQEAHAAVDVKPDAAGRDDGVGLGRVKGGHVADGEAVAGVQVGHGHGHLVMRVWVGGVDTEERKGESKKP